MRPALVALAVSLIAAASASAYPGEVRMRDVPGTGGAWQEARAMVAAPPDVVRRWLVDYRGWPSLFADVSSVQILSVRGPATVIRYHSRIFDRTLVVELDQQADGSIRYHGRDGSVATEGKIFITDAGHGTSDVIFQNVAHVSGLIGVLAPRHMVRDRQRLKLRSDLLDLQEVARHALQATAPAARF